MQERWERGAELADVYDDTRGFCRGGETAATGNAGIYGAEELFLGVGGGGAVEGEGYGHILDEC